MSWLLHTGFREYLILNCSENPNSAICDDFADAESARRFLSQFQNDCFCMATLRDLLAYHGCVHDLCNWNDGRILQCVAWELASGRLRIAEEAHRVISGAGQRETAEAEESVWPPQEMEPETETTWIEVKLVDAEMEPVANVRYQLTLPDGSSREGKLDAEGFARQDNVPPGMCKLAFPDLDMDSWDRIS